MIKKYKIVSFPHKGSGVIAKQKILRGELVCTTFPVKLDVERDPHSIQINDDRHAYISN